MKPIKSTELLSRFLFDEHIRNDGSIRYNAFLVAPRKQCSIFRTSDLDEKVIWEIGEKNVASKRGRDLKGRADIGAGTVLDLRLNNVPHTKLEIVPNEPPPYHADIILPQDKGQQKAFAIKLAEEAKFKSYNK